MTGEATESIVVERRFDYPPAKLWRALTQPWLIAEWLMPNDFAAERGHSFRFTAAAMPHWNGIVDCEVLEIEPEERLIYSWHTEASDGSAGLRTVVKFTLEPAGSGTLLTVEQSGFRANQPDNLRGAKFGWMRNLGQLSDALGNAH